jgi:hypothetical protein
MFEFLKLYTVLLISFPIKVLTAYGWYIMLYGYLYTRTFSFLFYSSLKGKGPNTIVVERDLIQMSALLPFIIQKRRGRGDIRPYTEATSLDWKISVFVKSHCSATAC